MEIADSFVPTAGVVGILPLVTYFFLVVAVYIFLGTFIAALAIRPAVPVQRSLPIFTAIITAVAALSYYQIQGYYHDMLAELATVTDPGNRQVLIRESYNAIGQYRFMDWAVTIPLLLIQAVTIRTAGASMPARPFYTIVAASFFMILTGYIGHQQLAFDNEILIGQKALWGVVSMLGYAALIWLLRPLWKQYAPGTPTNRPKIGQLTTLSIGMFGLIYPVGYFLSLTNIDSNLIHILYTVGDVGSKVAMGFAIYGSSSPEAIEPST